MVRLSGRHTAEVPVFAVLNTVNNDNQASAQGREWEVSLEDCVLRPTETCKVAEDVPVAAEKVRVRDFSAGIRPKPVEMRTGLTPQPPLCVCDPLADVKYYSNGR